MLISTSFLSSMNPARDLKLLNDLKTQKDLFAEEKEKADICKQFADMNSDKLSAIKKTFQSVLDGEHKKDKASTIMWNARWECLWILIGGQC